MALLGDRHEVMAGQAGRHCHREPGDRTLHPVIVDGARRGAAHDPIVVIEYRTLHQPSPASACDAVSCSTGRPTQGRTVRQFGPLVTSACTWRAMTTSSRAWITATAGPGPASRIRSPSRSSD